MADPLPAICDKLGAAGYAFGVGTKDDTGEVFVATPTGIVYLGAGRDVADLAVMLADYCDDNDLRSIVREHWYEKET